MRKSLFLFAIIGLVLFGAQAFASPPIAPPPETFEIWTNTSWVCGLGQEPCNFQESERGKWTYFEGWGTGPFYPNGYIPVGAYNCGFNGPPCAEPETIYATNELGFSEGAEIAYQQSFTAKDAAVGSYFEKELWWQDHAFSFPNEPDELHVQKMIGFFPFGSTSYAEHTEKVGLSVISMGKAAGSPFAANPAEGLLTLCPWAASSGGSADAGYPATNEGIAAGSHFKVTQIQGFTSESKVNSSELPMLSYHVNADNGIGFIEAGFVVELWEAPKGFVWAPVVDGTAGGTCIDCECCGCNPRTQPGGPWILPQTYGPPPLASRTSYKEYASADGTWSFTKSVKYQSVMPGAASSATFPIDQVLVPYVGHRAYRSRVCGRSVGSA